MQPFRIDPQLPVHAYKTYALSAPAATHRRPATCQEVDCEPYANGWVTTIDTSTELGAQQANYIRLHSGRHFQVEENGPLVTFKFPPGQRCFGSHSVLLEREPILTVRGGDWRGLVGGVRRHVNTADWVDDFATHQQRIADAIERG